MPGQDLIEYTVFMGWRYVQLKLKQTRSNKLALWVLTLLVGLVVISWTTRSVKSLFSPWNPSATSKKNFIWNKDFNINLAVRSKEISLLTFNPKDERIVIIDIPDEVLLEVPGEFGMWQLRAIYELGESQKGIGGDRLLTSALTSFLAIPIDGFLDFSALQPAKSATEIVEIIRKNPMSGLNLLSSLKTDLTPWELLNLKLSLNGVRFDKIKRIDLDKLDVLDKATLLDGTAVLRTDPVKLDSVLSDLVDPTIVKEHKSIAIFNATDHPQLALKAARLITNLGGNVIITTNAQDKLQKTKVLGEESPTLARLRQIFTSNDKISSQELDIVSSRAQINLFLGEDYVNR